MEKSLLIGAVGNDSHLMIVDKVSVAWLFYIVINADATGVDFYKVVRRISFLLNKFAIEDRKPPLSHLGLLAKLITKISVK